MKKILSIMLAVNMILQLLPVVSIADTVTNDSYTINSQDNIAPEEGYPVDMNDYSDSLIGYEATARDLNEKDEVLGGWSIYGSNSSRNLTLKQDNDCTKYFRFSSNNSTQGSTVGLYQLENQTNRYVVDMKIRFTAGKAEFGHYYRPANNPHEFSKPNWVCTYENNTLTVGTQYIYNINSTDWYRIIVSASEQSNDYNVFVYDKNNVLVGSVENEPLEDTANEEQKYFCFYGQNSSLFNLDLASFKIYNTSEVGQNVKFTFGDESLSETGYIHIGSDDKYLEDTEYGFEVGSSLVNAENGISSAEKYTYKVKIDNGDYTIKATTTSSNIISEIPDFAAADSGISRNTTQFNAAVCDGVLDLTFDADSVLSKLEITKIAEKPQREKPAIFAIGDSLTSNTNMGGKSWANCVNDGTELPDKFSAFYNKGRGGVNTQTYYSRGNLENVLLSIFPGDYVTICLGVNSANNEPYEELLENYYIQGVIQRGGIPVILTFTPDGPVGNYVSCYSKGVFNCSRSDNERVQILKKLADKCNLQLIDIGKWGNDYFNSLTDSDVLNYNTENGTSYSTVLEMVQSWYSDHNHYKEYLGNKFAQYIIDELSSKVEDSDNIVASGTCGDNLTWTLDDTGTLTISGAGAMTNLTKSDWSNKKRTPWYEYKDDIKHVVINNDVTSIGARAFYGCSGLTGITISDSVTSIGDNAFLGIKTLTAIEIPDSVSTIGRGAFEACNGLTIVKMSNGITDIDDYAFNQCSSLTSVKIPNGVTSIGIRMFNQCSSLTSIEIPNSVKSIGIRKETFLV